LLLNYCETLLTQIRERQKIYSERLCSGAFLTFEEYKFVSGILKGLKESEILTVNLYKNIFEPNKSSGKEGENFSD
jgi:hypothetical protein